MPGSKGHTGRYSRASEMQKWAEQVTLVYRVVTTHLCLKAELTWRQRPRGAAVYRAAGERTQMDRLGRGRVAAWGRSCKGTRLAGTEGAERRLRVGEVSPRWLSV